MPSQDICIYCLNQSLKFSYDWSSRCWRISNLHSRLHVAGLPFPVDYLSITWPPTVSADSGNRFTNANALHWCIDARSFRRPSLTPARHYNTMYIHVCLEGMRFLFIVVYCELDDLQLESHVPFIYIQCTWDHYLKDSDDGRGPRVHLQCTKANLNEILSSFSLLKGRIYFLIFLAAILALFKGKLIGCHVAFWTFACFQLGSK